MLNDTEKTDFMLATMNDRLGDTMLIEPAIRFIHHETPHMKQGWYIAYRIDRYEPERAFYLGATAGKVTKAFNLWLKAWKRVV